MRRETLGKGEERGWTERERERHIIMLILYTGELETDEACHLEVTTAILELISCTALFHIVTIADIEIRWYSSEERII